MQRIPIDFRQLLQRVLPLDALSPSERDRLGEDLAQTTSDTGEQIALYWIERLIERGALRRLPDLERPGEVVMRFQPVDSIESISIPFATPSPAAGLETIPQVLAKARSHPPTAKLALLQELDQTLLGESETLPGTRRDLLRAVEDTAKELLDCDQAVFFPAESDGGSGAAYAPPPGETGLLTRWISPQMLESGNILLCRELAACPALSSEGARQNLGSLAAIPLRSDAAGVSGFLELRAGEAGFFSPTRLSLLAVAAEQFSAFLTRAARLEGLVFIDSLTGAFNVNYFHQSLAGEVARARREGKSMALCIADIDNFKQFNTLYGYEGGNQVLIEVVRALRGGVRPFDSVARWGGEEFAVILAPPVGREEAETIAERLRHAVADSLLAVKGLDGNIYEVRVTISVGIALFPSDAENDEALWQAANQALLVAKKPPKNRTVFYSDITPDRWRPEGQGGQSGGLA
jgi:diguanylate cyclase (GGDEF)-like protein